MMRQGVLFAVASAVSFLMACAHAPEGFQATGGADQGVLVTGTDGARRSGLPAWSLSVPFEAGQDERVVETFLARAEAAGARYVSDLSLVRTTEEHGQSLECRRRLTPVLELETGRQVARTSSASRLLAEHRMYTEGDTRCSGRGRCLLASMPRTSTLYAYQHDSFLPRIEALTHNERRWRLEASAPECTRRELGPLAAAGPSQRIEGRAYGCADSNGPLHCEDKVLSSSP